VTSISRQQIREWLSLRGEEQRLFHQKAAALRDETVGNSLYFRGLVEASNICRNNCFYCGIRNGNRETDRYTLSTDQIISVMGEMAGLGFSSMVLQSGERNDRAFIDYICETLEAIKTGFPGTVITLSVGEQSEKLYRRFYESGAERYLLRIETSKRSLYETLHPPDMSFSERIACLQSLKKTGYQVGTGVMIHLPGQDIDDLAEDILFFKEMDIDMCGMGPYVPHMNAPLSFPQYRSYEAVNLTLNMIAALRYVMPDINIAATTALETIDSRGKEKGLNAGANVVMPQFSPEATRKDYHLYNNKPVDAAKDVNIIAELKDLADKCGMIAVFDDPGNSFHYKARTNTNGSTG
jgi:biotin synthase